MKKLILVLGVLAYSSAFSNPASNPYWEDVSQPNQFQQRNLENRGKAQEPLNSRILNLDVSALKEKLFSNSSLSARVATSRPSSLEIELPLPNGKFEKVQLIEYQLLSPKLQASYPDIKTWRVKGLNNSTISGRIDFTSAGFHGMLVMPDGDTVYIDPDKDSSSDQYLSFSKQKNHSHFKTEFSCGVHSEHNLFSKDGHAVEQNSFSKSLSRRTLAQQPSLNLITYKLALAATAEYTVSQGGTKASAYASMVTIINRVNEIYQRDIGVMLQLISGESLIYTNAVTDPYTSGDALALVNENIDNTNTQFGAANYDVGHVFDASQMGGLAYVGAACSTNYKAGGATGTNSPIGETFSIEYVAHEIGHQLGADHTFNSSLGGCGGGNRSSATAVEPGSGSSIMSYSGLCGSDNLQFNSDATFHIKSIEQINNFTRLSGGSSCGVSTSTDGDDPVVDAGLDLQIPANTPFLLAGSATGGSTYSWDQTDVGTSTYVNVDSGNNALIRMLLPSPNANRYIPRLSDLFAGTFALGEKLPTTSRELNFSYVVRNGAGGVGTDLKKVTVTNTGLEFKVLSQISSETFSTGQSVNVTWNVAGTNNPPIYCSSVDINLIRLNGENAEKNLLLANTDNDGTEQLVVPINTPTMTGARVMVACSSQDFFQISSGNIEVIQGAGDLIAPIVTIIGGSQITITQGTTYADAGATATDNVDPQVTVQSAGTVNTSVVGNYQITYSAADSAGNTGSAIRTVTVIASADTEAPVITLLGNASVTVVQGETYIDAGATATDNIDAIISVSVSNPVDTNVIGQYTITYNATNNAGNSAVKTRSVEVIAASTPQPDNTAPVISIIGDQSISLNVGESYIELGATALDNIDGALTVVTSGEVNTNVADAYFITYTATDAAGNSATKTRTVLVNNPTTPTTPVTQEDTVAPIITLVGSTTINLTLGESYNDPGFSGFDSIDGFLTVTVSGFVNTNVAGTYILTYTATDAAGNTVSKTRTIVVTAPSIVIPPNTLTPEEPVIVVPATPEVPEVPGDPATVTPESPVVDAVLPVITLVGNTSITLDIGAEYAEPGFEGFDPQDGELTVVAEGTVDTSKPGTYIITYTATDAAGSQ